MENIGDWLYVIILIIAGIASVISSAKKNAKQREEQKLPQETVSGDIFDDEFWGSQTSDSKPAPVVAPKVEVRQVRQFEAKPKKNNFHQYQEGMSSITNTNMESIFTDIEDEISAVTIKDLPANAEDWRKAIIYNEIINRKY